MHSVINFMASCVVIPRFLDHHLVRTGSALLQTLCWSMCAESSKTSMTEKQALLLSAVLDKLSEVPLKHIDKLTIVTDPDPFLFMMVIRER